MRQERTTYETVERTETVTLCDSCGADVQALGGGEVIGR